MVKKYMKNEKGFTLAELLIVVAIIAVLVAVSIPIFNAQLEKSREATDLANFRAAKAAFIVEFISNLDLQTSPNATMAYDAERGTVKVMASGTTSQGGSGPSYGGEEESGAASYSYGQGTEKLGSVENNYDYYIPEGVSYKNCYVIAKYVSDKDYSHTLEIYWTEDGDSCKAGSPLTIDLDEAVSE